MEKPDANGFVNINWPSKNVPHGGIFHSQVVKPTSDQKEFLKVLLDESKLSIALRKKSALALREHESKIECRPEQHKPLVRPRTSRRRSLSAIRDSGAFEFDPFLPQKRGEDREKLKERLASMMAHGDVTPQQTPPKPQRVANAAPKLPTSKEMWHNLVTQIRERAEWLAEMEYLGEAGPHRDIIKDQIAERMRALDALGVDSACSTARSTASGFSTLRSRETSQKCDQHIRTTRSDHTKSPQKHKARQDFRKTHGGQEENISAYKLLSPLQYSPRRRV